MNVDIFDLLLIAVLSFGIGALVMFIAVKS